MSKIEPGTLIRIVRLEPSVIQRDLINRREDQVVPDVYQRDRAVFDRETRAR